MLWTAEQSGGGGLSGSAGSMTAAVADVDGDGDLDLYIANNKPYTAIDRIPPQERAFDHITRTLGPDRYEVRPQYRRDYKVIQRADLGGFSLVQRADPDFFYLNDGRGTSRASPWRATGAHDEAGASFPRSTKTLGLRLCWRI